MGPIFSTHTTCPRARACRRSCGRRQRRADSRRKARCRRSSPARRRGTPRAPRALRDGSVIQELETEMETETELETETESELMAHGRPTDRPMTDRPTVHHGSDYSSAIGADPGHGGARITGQTGTAATPPTTRGVLHTQHTDFDGPRRWSAACTMGAFAGLGSKDITLCPALAKAMASLPSWAPTSITRPARAPRAHAHPWFRRRAMP